MKTPQVLLAFVVALVGCDKIPLESAEVAGEPTEAFFKSGHGVCLPPAMQESLGIEVADVEEQRFAPTVRIPLHVLHGEGGFRRVANAGAPVEAAGWVSTKDVAALSVGQSARLITRDGSEFSGTITQLVKSPSEAFGEWEVVVGTNAPLETGAMIHAIVELPPGEEVVAVPASAVLKTAEGEFVYVVNGDYFARTPVETGARNDELVEIADGLYPGDQIVVSQVTPLWMTELQSLRAGQACCKGH